MGLVYACAYTTAHHGLLSIQRVSRSQPVESNGGGASRANGKRSSRSALGSRAEDVESDMVVTWPKARCARGCEDAAPLCLLPN